MEEPRRRIAAPPAGFQVPPAPSSLPPSPLFPSLSIGAAGACGVPARAIPPRFPPRACLAPAIPVRAPHACPFPRIFSRCFSCERATSCPAWRPSDAMATPFFTRRRHTPESRGGLDAAIQKSPGRQGDAIKTMVLCLGYVGIKVFKASPRPRHLGGEKTWASASLFHSSPCPRPPGALQLRPSSARHSPSRSRRPPARRPPPGRGRARARRCGRLAPGTSELSA